MAEAKKEFEPHLLIDYLEAMMPFIIPDDILPLSKLAAERWLIDDVIKDNLEAMHHTVTSQKKFRYLIWALYSNKSSVNVFLSLLATFPSGKSMAEEYKCKSAPGKKVKFLNKKKRSIYDWLVKRFSDTDVWNINQEIVLSERNEIVLSERNENPFVLLEVYSGAISPRFRYDWYKNGLRQESTTPLLCITVADISSEGTYSFMRNNKPMGTIKVYIKTILDQFRQDLAIKYLRTVTNVDEDEWPKVKQNTYINLAVIKSDKSDNLSSYVCQTIHGDADNIHGEKGETDYKSAFESVQHGETVIVQGRPGSGKTTLVHKISQDWADHSIEWGHIKALFLIHLRGFRSRPSINLRDFLECYYTSEETVKLMGDYINSKDGLGVCFILDGLDEYQPNDKTAFVFKLIEKKVLSKAVVIVASRPAAVAKCRSRGKSVEVLGFFKKQISAYIDSYEFLDPSSSFMLKEYLANTPNIHHMCYLPIQLAMICFLYDHFEEKGNIFPHTETEVYEQFARHTLLRSLYRQSSKENLYLKSIFSLPGVEQRLLRSICTLAFEKTLSSMQVLEQADVDIFCEQINTNSCLGLLTVDRKATICGFQNMYTFCHLTFQEFLTACHIFLSPEDKQLALIEICKEKQHMAVVMKFFCGLADFESDNAALFKSIINSRHLNNLAKIQCSFESKQPITCQHVAKNNTLNITENFLTTRDWSSIGFVIANASHYPVKSLHLNYSAITEEGTKALTKSIKSNNLITIQKLQILGNLNQLPLFFINCLHQLQVFCSSLNVSVANLRELYRNFQHSEIKVIQFYDNGVPKLSIKFDLAPLKYLLSLSSMLIEKEATGLEFFPLLSHIIEKSLTSANRFLARELNYQLYNIYESSKCIKIIGMAKNDSRQNIMTVNRSNQQIQKIVDVISTQKQTKNFSVLFSDYTLKYTDIIPFGNYLIVVIVLATKVNTYFRLYVHPNEYVNNVGLECMDKNVESLELGVSYHSPNKYYRRLCIHNHLNEDLELQQLFNHTLEQLEIKCDDTNDYSYLTESLDKCPELKSFSFQASETMLVPAVRNMVESLSSKKIEVLELTNCDLEHVMDVSLVPALRAWKTLRELCLKNCSITGKSVTSLVRAIAACAQLTALDLSGNDIGDEGCHSMFHKCSEMCSLTHLRRLNLSNCNIKDAGICFLANTLKNYTSLEFLCMTNTAFKNVSLEELFLAFQNSKNLIEMDLSHSTLKSFSAFSSLALKSLQILKLCACKSQDFSLAPLMKNKLLMSSLRVLDLSGNNWPVSNLIQIFDLTKELQELSLSGLSLSENDTKDLARVLSKLRNLNVIRFNYFKIKAYNFSFMQLLTNTNITVLELCHLECDYYIREICYHNIPCAISLHSLDLSHNVAINIVSQTLSWSIKQCQKLNTLRLCDCGIRNNEAEQLAAAIIACESIRSIDMSQNDFDGVHSELIYSNFTHCDHLITFRV